MGQDLEGLVLRDGNLITKIMLRSQDQVIDHIDEEKMELNLPVNQMGDTLLHYAAYKSLNKLIDYLLQHQADPYIHNHRHLTPIDVSMPQVRERIIRKHNEISELFKKEKSVSRGKKDGIVSREQTFRQI